MNESTNLALTVFKLSILVPLIKKKKGLEKIVSRAAFKKMFGSIVAIFVYLQYVKTFWFEGFQLVRL